jgi:uncharacterized membrane protein
MNMNILFLISSSFGLIFLIAGVIQFKFPPKKINDLYGYRTKRSMKNIEIWNYAQKYSSKILIIYGSIYIVINIILSLLIESINNWVYTIYVIISLIMLSILIIT